MYLSYNIHLQKPVSGNGLSHTDVVRRMVDITYFDVEYNTSVSIPPEHTFDLEEFEILAKHKYKETGYVTIVKFVSRFQYQIYTNISLERMKQFFADDIMKLYISEITIPRDASMSEDERALIKSIEAIFETE